ncbi:tetratricopeptide repeat protein [Roseococcus pinisoli]|uniref:Tetratricopeptide repeat protein n=1 Tax=Roseococcus pinisoli TaxID=2835040 RepID=A0ABS5QG08_9PROT|nr:hypothetical protein [Roseococcus pinisoli]MBS7812625.1 hypothetical protein [Roseococcus pinisoli]
MRRVLLCLLLGLLAGTAAAQERVGVRTGDHPGFGRIVFDWAAPPRYQVQVQDDRVLLRFRTIEPVDLSGAHRLPRNLLAVSRGDGVIELQMAPGARLRHFRNGPKVALDFLDPPYPQSERRAAAPARVAPPVMAGVPAPPAVPELSPPAPAVVEEQAIPNAPPSPQPEPAEAISTKPAEGPSPHQSPVEEAAVAAPPQSFPVLPVQDHVPPTSTRVSLADPAPIRARLQREEGQQPILRIPAGAGVGAAALRRGDHALVILDADRPVDLGQALRSSAFPEIRMQRLAGGTLITWKLPADERLLLRREGQDWSVQQVMGSQVTTPTPEALDLTSEGERFILRTEQPSRVVALSDPLTGLPLLIGTVIEAAPQLVASRSLAEFDLVATFLGAAVVARADRVSLRAGAGRFLISVEGGAVAAAGSLSGETASRPGMTRSFDLPSLPALALQERLRVEQASIGEAAPLLRTEPRLAAAQTLLALGLPQEAQAMLRVAAQESPQAAQEGRLAFLAGMGALIGGRPGEAGGLDAELPRSDEVLLWRALRAALRGEPVDAAPGLAATMPLLLSYPEGLRRRVLPIAVEALAEGGRPAEARRLLDQAGEDPSLVLAQGLLEEAQGNAPEALEAYDRAIGGRDRLARARALRRATELRLGTGRLDAAAAAQQLEQTLFAWRGDAQEISLRERLAELRGQAGDPRAALALLRETEALFPERAAALRGRLQQAFLQALEMEPPLGAVGLYDAYPDLLPTGAEGVAVLALLSERLTALDLPNRAAEVLRRAVERLPAGESRATLGALLAERHLGEGEADRALEALALSSAPRLPSALTDRRTLLAAQAEARRGNRQLALEAVRALGPAGDEQLAELLAEGRDFPGAAMALSRHLANIGARSEWSEPLQYIALRNAVYLAMAGDEAGLAAHRSFCAGRVTRPDLSAAFEALTVDPVRGLADLPRLSRELNLFRRFPQSLEPLRTAQRTAG